MNLQHLRYFVVVAECLNFTKAAELLYITQPCLSRHISNLELELGVVLFDRDKRSISLTESGKQLLSETYPLIRSYERLVSKMREGSQTGKIKLSIGYNGWLEPVYFQYFLKEFISENPQIDVHIRKSNLVENMELVKNDEIDLMLGLFSGRESMSGLCTKTITPITSVLVVNREHILAGKTSVNFHDIKNEAFVVLTRELRPFVIDRFNSYFTDRGVTPGIIRHAEDRMDYYTLIEAGIGVGLTCSLYATPEPDFPDLVYIPVSDHEILYYFIVWNEMNTSPAITTFCEKITEFINRRGKNKSDV